MMRFSVRLHDAVDTDTVLRRFLPVLAGERSERRVAFAEYDPARELLVHRWTTGAEGSTEIEDGAISLEPARLHTLLSDDAMGDRPLRPADSAPAWALRDVLPGLEPERYWVRVRAVTHENRWMGVLVIATPRRWWLPRRSDDSMEAGGDVLELCLGRAWALRGAESPGLFSTGLAAIAAGTPDRARAAEREADELRRANEVLQRKLDAMERAAEGATEMLIEAHVELDRRSSRARRQTRLLFLLRRMLERHAERLPAGELAQEVVRTVSEAFEGHRCSMLLLDRSRGVDELRVGAAVGFPAAVDHGEVRVPLGSGISGAVARTQSAVVVRDTEEAQTHPLVGDEWYTGTAFVSLPLVSRGRVHGVLNLTNFREGTIDNTEVEQLRLVALCVGLIVDQAALAERLFAPEAE